MLAGYPLFLVFGLGAPIYIYGLIEALNYGGGALFSLIGGRISDRIGRKKTAIIGNSLIPVLALTGLAHSVKVAASLFIGGWWSRNFRSPARRAMMAEVTERRERKQSFGILHALDVGGGAIAVIYASAMVALGYEFRTIFLITIIPLVVSTIVLTLAERGKRLPSAKMEPRAKGNAKKRGMFGGVVIAASLFGFSYYSFGFPIITIAQSTHTYYIGMLSYLVFLASSSLTGYAIGRSRIKELTGLAFFGYLLAAVASLGFAFLYGYGVSGLYPAALILGIATGFIETMEPSIISKVVPSAKEGGGMGSLGMSRSIGLFLGNTIMGVLYSISYFDSYIYAAATSFVAFGIILYVMAAHGSKV